MKLNTATLVSEDSWRFCRAFHISPALSRRAGQRRPRAPECRGWRLGTAWRPGQRAPKQMPPIRLYRKVTKESQMSPCILASECALAPQSALAFLAAIAVALATAIAFAIIEICASALTRRPPARSLARFGWSGWSSPLTYCTSSRVNLRVPTARCTLRGRPTLQEVYLKWPDRARDRR